MSTSIAVDSTTGYVGIGTTTLTYLLNVGDNGTVAGSINVASTSGGGAVIKNPSAVTSYNFNLPSTAGTPGYALTSAGGGVTPMAWAPMSGIPAGTIILFAGTVAPVGFLLCQGQSVSTTTYAALFAVIGYSYGGSGGSFVIPDTRGIFVRGAGTHGTLTNANGAAFAATLGSAQNDQVQSHYHAQQAPELAGSSSVWALNFWSASRATTTSADASFPTIAAPITDGSNGTPRTGVETRPANIAFNYMISYM